MGKSTEGVVLKDGQIESLSDALAQLDISSAVNGREIEARKLFVQNLIKAIGDLTNKLMPIGIKPTLQRLILAADFYIEHGNENEFVRLCDDAVEVTRQGWSILSHWMSSSDNMSYTIHWGLKQAMERHKKEILKVTTQQNHASKNDAVSSCSDNPNATRNQPESNCTTKESFQWSKPGLLKQILTQYSLERSKKVSLNVVRVNSDPFASCQELYKNKF